MRRLIHATRRRSTASLFLLLPLFLSVRLSAEEPLRTAGERRIDVLHSRLELEVLLQDKRIRGTATIDFKPLRRLSTVVLDAVDHEVSTVERIPADGESNERLEFENTGKKLRLRFPESIERGRTTRVRIAYRVREPKSGLYFFQPTESEPDVPLMCWSQGEATYNRYWFPCIDHPNERQSTEMIAVVEPGFEVLSNGTLISRQETAGGKKVRWHWSQEKSHVAYLVTLVVGKFAVVREDWRGKPVLYYVPPDRKQDIQRTFGRTREMLDFFSERFGIAYPWEKYAQVVVEQFIAGGMENTSATTLYDAALHDERAMLDGNPDWLIAHELGHQWWGDLVTCKDWSHLWLNEGFATFCEVLWAEHHLGRDEHDYRLYEKSRAARSDKTKTRPIVDRRYPNPGTMFDNRAYPKGCWVLHMLRRQLGDGDFFRVLELYGKRFAYQTAETSDLRQVFEEFTGRSCERYFYDWTERAGHPELTVKSRYVAGDRMVEVSLKQTQEGEAFHFPLQIELVFAGERKPVTVDKYVDEKELTLFLPAAERPRTIRIDPEFALLADLNEDKSRDWWVAQLEEAPAVPERIRAVEHFGKSKTAADRELLAGVLKGDAFYGVRVEAAKALGKSGGDDSRDALFAGLNQSDARVRRACAEALGNFEDDEQVARALADRLQKQEPSYQTHAALLESLAKTQTKVDAAVFQKALKQPSHREAVRQAALKGLARADDAHVLSVLQEWTERGKPRECRSAAAQAIAERLNRREVSDAQKRAALETLTGLCKDDSRRVRLAAIGALKDLGPTARPARDTLTALSTHDPYGRVRAAAGEALKQLDAETPATAELNRLRKEIEALQKRNKELENRLQKLEASESVGASSQ